jgi:hypothetical protein
MPEMWLVLFEATGKQSFIFDTNKLRENLGASQLILESTTSQLVSALGPGCGLTVSRDGTVDGIGAQPAIEAERTTLYEVIIATSGKALVLARSRVLAEDLIWRVTSQALAHTPGLRIVGTSAPFEWGDHGALNQASAAVHQRLDVRASSTASARFVRLPVVDDCATSGLPAAFAVSDEPEPGAVAPRSHSVIAKRDARPRSIRRLKDTFRDIAESADAFDQLDLSWVAVVHADGNGLGAVFSDFGRALESSGRDTDSRSWVTHYREFSQEVERITTAAFRHAIETVPLRERPRDPASRRPAERIRPVVPIVLGGDDLTVVCDGRYAWRFTRAYLGEFNRLAAGSRTISAVMPRPPGDTSGRPDSAQSETGALTASGGIAFVKAHFSFRDAYALAGELCSSAKMLKPASAIDFHAVYDSTIRPLSELRPLSPGAVAPTSLPVPTSEVAGLEELHRRLASRVDGRPEIPNSKVHEIRELLTRGSTDQATREWERLHQHHAGPPPLVERTGGRTYTLLLDALTLADIAEPGDEGAEPVTTGTAPATTGMGGE